MARSEPRVRSIKRERIRYFSQKYLPNFFGGNVRKKERGKKEIQTSLFDSRSFVRPRTKVSHFDEGYA